MLLGVGLQIISKERCEDSSFSPAGYKLGNLSLNLLDSICDNWNFSHALQSYRLIIKANSAQDLKSPAAWLILKDKWRKKWVLEKSESLDETTPKSTLWPPTGCESANVNVSVSVDAVESCSQHMDDTFLYLFQSNISLDLIQMYTLLSLHSLTVCRLSKNCHQTLHSLFIFLFIVILIIIVVNK